MDFSFSLIVPELYQLFLILALFVFSLVGPDAKPAVNRWLPAFSAVGVLAAIAAYSTEGSMLYGAYQVDGLSQFFKIVIALGFTIAVVNASRQPTLKEGKRADYFMFMALSAWGLMLLSSAVELITMYLALELASYSLYAILPLRGDDRRASEAGIKYIMFGAVATALALYGFSYILASQHTTYLVDLATKNWHFIASPLGVIGLSLFMVGMLYKLALFPFHFWAPDVYQGSSNETAAFVATLPKLGAVVILIRLTSLLKPGLEITTIIAVLAACSMTYANLAALVQKDVKRILGYSTVSHAGYIMVGLVAGTVAGMAAACFYALCYILMNFACFWVLCRAGSDGRNMTLDDLSGLHSRSPGLAFTLAVGAFALVGLPPTAGFMGKLFLLTSAWDHGYNWLIIIAAVNTAISIYYYLNMVRHAYTRDTPARTPAPVTERAYSVGFGMALALFILVLGILPSPAFNWAMAAGQQLFK